MIIETIQISISREALEYEEKIVKTKCIQQSDILADDDRYQFLKPMADYIAHLIIEEEK